MGMGAQVRARRFVGIHGLVCGAQCLFQFDAIVWIDSLSDTRTDRYDHAVVERDGFTDRSFDFSAYRIGRERVVRAFDDQDEFISPQPRSRVGGTQRYGEPPCHFDQHGVSSGMPMGIVDALETVQVDHQHRK